MIDFSHIPSQQDGVSIYYAKGTTTWQTWEKPRGCSHIWTMCIGGAAGGGGGGTNAGGAGGGSGAITTAIFAASVLPDVLYIQPGVGGKGAAGVATAGPVTGGAGNRSIISVTTSGSSVMGYVNISGTVAAAGSTGETAATTAAPINGINSAGLLSLGTYTSIAGRAGAAVGVDATPLTSTITCGGAGGASTTTTGGGSTLSVDLVTFSTQVISGGGATGQAGGNGTWSWKPMYGLGGAGGGGSASGRGGNGGKGAYGCGGGGGGIGFGASGGGSGGDGGDGLVIIVSY